MRHNGNTEAKILILTDYPGPNEMAEETCLAGSHLGLLMSHMAQARLGEADFCFASIYPEMPAGNSSRNLPTHELPQHIMALRQFLNSHDFSVVVPLGAFPLKILSGDNSITKLQLSVLKARPDFGGVKLLPLYHPRDVDKDYARQYYYGVGAKKIASEMFTRTIHEPDRLMRISPTFEESIDFIQKAHNAPEICLDVETGRGQINLLGISISPEEAIAIPTLPERYGAEKLYQLWLEIAKLMASPVPKVAQNALYEAMWLSYYGIPLNNVIHDTMACQKFLSPEFPANLGEVGRIHTPFQYWKDDNESWEDIRDWTKHALYNCKDTTGTHFAYYSQVEELQERKLNDLYYNYIQKLFYPVLEMCSRGLLVDEVQKEKLTEQNRTKVAHYTKLVNEEIQAVLGSEVVTNLRSPAQLKTNLTKMGFKIPKVVDKTTGQQKESTDKKSLAKLKKQYPKAHVFDYLMKLSKENKLASSYLSFQYHEDKRVRYSMNFVATETGRFNGGVDFLGRGFNPQTVPKSMRSMFVAPPGYVLMQIDLKQAESRYVAWDAPELTLMKLIQEGRDIHKYVAAGIFGVPESAVTDQQRTLGKKSGHAANYGVGPRTFAEACLLDGIVVTELEAKRIIEGYHEVFPGVRQRQRRIINEVRSKRKLTTPIGRERYFYGRMNDATFREAFAYAPQSTIPDITNHLLLYIAQLEYLHLLLQCHDSLLLAVPNTTEKISEVADICRDTDLWHPTIHLAGGQLVIPTDVEVGTNWKEMGKL